MSIINKDIAAIREDYALNTLQESDVLNHPMAQFSKWFQEALQSEVIEPTAMVVSTVDAACKPSSRVVLMKDIKPEGITFFTNYASHKGKDLEINPYASVLFFWPELQRQVRMEVHAEKVSVSESDEYFAIRPRGSRIGAIASPQSAEIKDRAFLENAVNQVEELYKDKEEIPRPSNWGGYYLKPSKIEFWQGRSSRLHDRIVYELENENWIIKRIAP